MMKDFINKILRWRSQRHGHQASNLFADEHWTNRQKSTIGIAAFIAVAAIFIFAITSHQAGYASGEQNRARVDRRVRLEHPKIKYVYREHIVKKHIPVVHVENASGKQISKAMKHTHKADLNDVKNIDKKYSKGTISKSTAQRERNQIEQVMKKMRRQHQKSNKRKHNNSKKRHYNRRRNNRKHRSRKRKHRKAKKSKRHHKTRRKKGRKRRR